jgi:nitric oxide reductase NorQ protein
MDTNPAADESTPPRPRAARTSSGASVQSIADVLGSGSAGADSAAARKRVSESVGVLDDAAQQIEEAQASAHKRPAAQIASSRFAPVERPGGQLYYPRQMVGMEMTDVELLRAARSATNNPDASARRELYSLLSGRPGCGKTALVEAAFGDELLTIEGTGHTEDGDIVGSFAPDPNRPGGYLWMPGKLVEAMEQGRPLLIDDATLIPPNVIARLYPAMDGRRQITVTQHLGEIVTARACDDASGGFFVVMSHNPGAPGALLAEAMNSRCRLQMTVSTDMNVARMLDVPRAFITLAQQMHEHRADSAHELSWAPEMREMITFRDMDALFGADIACANLLGQIQDPFDRKLVAEILSVRYGQIEPLAPGKSQQMEP